jgi:uncharacterized membrane protein
VALLGLVAYAAILATVLSKNDWVKAGGAAIALAGVGFSAYLVYVQAFLLEAFCSWCLASDVMLVLAAATTLLRLACGNPAAKTADEPRGAP